jgi:hypothetical protein
MADHGLVVEGQAEFNDSKSEQKEKRQNKCKLNS